MGSYSNNRQWPTMVFLYAVYRTWFSTSLFHENLYVLVHAEHKNDITIIFNFCIELHVAGKKPCEV